MMQDQEIRILWYQIDSINFDIILPKFPLPKTKTNVRHFGSSRSMLITANKFSGVVDHISTQFPLVVFI